MTEGEPTADPRLVHRLVVDVLLDPQDRPAVMDLLGEALCAAPDDHEGPCRIAWSLACAVEGEADDDEAPYGLGPDDVAHLREHLGPVEVWEPAAVTASFGPRAGDAPDE